METKLTKKFAKYFDHTQLKPNATKDEIDQLISEAKEYDFASICVNPYWVKYASQKLATTDVKVVTTIGFPLGATTTAAKVYEAEDALANGADECDMVENVGELLAGNYTAVLNDELLVANVVHKRGKKLKVIIETCLLSNEQIVKACQIAREAGADFVKTSTGFSTSGATIADVKLMADTVGDTLEVKASGGIYTKAEALEMIANGASRIGASASVMIMQED